MTESPSPMDSPRDAGNSFETEPTTEAASA
jgi:hypothetical protein